MHSVTAVDMGVAESKGRESVQFFITGVGRMCLQQGLLLLLSVTEQVLDIRVWKSQYLVPNPSRHHKVTLFLCDTNH